MNKNLTEAEEFLEYAITIGAIGFSTEGIPLKSGKVSPYFFNSAVFYDRDRLWELVDEFVMVINDLQSVPEVLFGPPYKGTVLVPAITMQLLANVGWASNRKEPKEHAEGGSLLGSSLRGKRVIIVDDVYTDGKTKRDSVKLIQDYGGTVTAIVVAFDRMETAGESDYSESRLFEIQQGIPVYSVATMADMVHLLEKSPPRLVPQENIDAVLTYYKKHCTA